MRFHSRNHRARSTDSYLFQQLIPYLGGKRKLLDLIGDALTATGINPANATFVDLFAGSGAVARLAKQRGFAVVANDWEPYAATLNTAAIAVDRPPPCPALGGYAAAIAALDALPGAPDWITDNLCPADDEVPDPGSERLFYRRATGARLDAIRNRIAAWQAADLLDPAATACLLAPLLYQASWLANTSGVFKGFHAGWGGRNGTALHRILADLELRPMQFLDTGRRHQVHQADALALAAELPHAEVVYLDPPYNQHPYASNYHVLNSLVLWDRPALPPATARGQKAAIRADWKARRSPFNHRRDAASAYQTLLSQLRADSVLSSYSTDGTIPVADLIAANTPFGAVEVFCRRYHRYRTSPTRPSPRPTTVEFVLWCDRRRAPRPGDGERAMAAIAAAAAASGGEGRDPVTATAGS